jgi:hypothetical protein
MKPAVTSGLATGQIVTSLKESCMVRQFVRILFAFCLIAPVCLAGAAARAADAPLTLSGITLGDEAARHKDRLNLTKQRPVDGAPWVRRIAVKKDKFFTGGYVLVGTCAAPGRVVRVKLHYQDQSLDYYRTLAGDLLKQYGDPSEYKGDFDGRTMGNKWAFTDGQTRPVSLILQRTEAEDPEIGTGNTIKLTNWGLLEAERTCWQERQAPAAAKKQTKSGAAGQDTGPLPR